MTRAAREDTHPPRPMHCGASSHQLDSSLASKRDSRKSRRSRGEIPVPVAGMGQSQGVRSPRGAPTPGHVPAAVATRVEGLEGCGVKTGFRPAKLAGCRGVPASARRRRGQVPALTERGARRKRGPAFSALTCETGPGLPPGQGSWGAWNAPPARKRGEGQAGLGGSGKRAPGSTSPGG